MNFIDDGIATTGAVYLDALPLFTQNFTLIGMGGVIDTDMNAGSSLLDLGACFDEKNNYAFDATIRGCLKTWKTKQFERNRAKLFEFKPEGLLLFYLIFFNFLDKDKDGK